MMIHNGDHAEFEIEHANTPKEQRPDWPMPSFDAMDWAQAFHKKHPTVDVDDALCWFAAALMRGLDEHASRHSQDVREFIGWLSGDLPELHTVEVPRIAASWERFRAAR
jgi:hypothetical protein